jgi:hypothetical protein
MSTNYLGQTYGERFFDFLEPRDFSKEFEQLKKPVRDN